jgi:hypothetical protein
MVSDRVVRRTTAHLFVGLAVIAVGNLLGGILGGSRGPAGLVVYLLVALPALYVGLGRVVRGVATLADGVVDARTGPVASSSALDPRSPFEFPFPGEEDVAGRGGDAGGPADESDEAAGDDAPTDEESPDDGSSVDDAGADARADDDSNGDDRPS